MSLKERMREQKENSRVREAQAMKLYKEDKNFRADRLVSAWAKVPEIGTGLSKLPLTEARNVAINLDRQTNFMQGLKESQMSTALNDFTPENMLRLVRLAMPNIIRNKLFTEFALETTKDSIKYIRPFFSKTAGGHDLNDKSQVYSDAEGHDPWDYEKGGEINGDDYRKALYEDTRDRANQELANTYVATVSTAVTNPDTGAATGAMAHEVTAYFTDTVPGVTINNPSIAKWGANGVNYVDGYTYIYYGPASTDKAYKANAANLEQNVIAMQNKGAGNFYAANGFKVTMTRSPLLRDKFLYSPVKMGPGTADDWSQPISPDGSSVVIPNGTGIMVLNIEVTAEMEAEILAKYPDGYQIYAFGRYNSESDFAGDYLGEVEIRMDEYTFRPSATAIGVSWSQLTEITLDTGFNTSAEEILITYASQEIRSALDYRAVRLAYGYAKTNSINDNRYVYNFDAAWNPTGAASTLEGYLANAQTFGSAIDAIGDTMFNDINRGGVNRMVGGPSACSYLKLNAGFSTKGAQIMNGPHQFGELDGRPLFKVPSSVIPNDEILTIWKNEAVENDVSIAFGTLIPFFSTGIIQRKNFYKEAGLATYGDWAVLNRRYLALIKVSRMKDYVEN